MVPEVNADLQSEQELNTSAENQGAIWPNYSVVTAVPKIASHLQLMAAALRGFALHDHLLDERHHDDHQCAHARRRDAVRRLL